MGSIQASSFWEHKSLISKKTEQSDMFLDEGYPCVDFKSMPPKFATCDAGDGKISKQEFLNQELMRADDEMFASSFENICSAKETKVAAYLYDKLGVDVPWLFYTHSKSPRAQLFWNKLYNFVDSHKIGQVDSPDILKLSSEIYAFIEDNNEGLNFRGGYSTSQLSPIDAFIQRKKNLNCLEFSMLYYGIAMMLGIHASFILVQTNVKSVSVDSRFASYSVDHMIIGMKDSRGKIRAYADSSKGVTENLHLFHMHSGGLITNSSKTTGKITVHIGGKKDDIPPQIAYEVPELYTLALHYLNMAALNHKGDLLASKKDIGLASILAPTLYSVSYAKGIWEFLFGNRSKSLSLFKRTHSQNPFFKPVLSFIHR